MSSLASDFHCINDNRDVPALENNIVELFTLEKENCKNIIHFDNAIMPNRRKIKCEHNLRYNLTIRRKNDDSDILNGISENFTLVQLMDSLRNLNHDIVIVGHWIIDSKYKKSLCLTQKPLDIICSPSNG